MTWEPVKVLGPVEVGWGSVKLCSGAATASPVFSAGCWLRRVVCRSEIKKAPGPLGCGGCWGETVVSSAGRRTRAKKEPERNGNDDNDAAHFLTDRRRQLRRA